MNAKRGPRAVRPRRLPEGSPLEYEPDNEQGVVFLFSHLARKRYQLRVERVRTGFPDCVAYRGDEEVRIEFEYRSSSFRRHGHRASGCDWIVCWIHDWPGVPERLRVVELRREYGLGLNVWFQPIRSGEYSERLGRLRSDDSWTVPPAAGVGDLLLYYRSAPESLVRDVFRVAGPVRAVSRAGWKPGGDHMAAIRRVCALKTPLHLSEMRGHRILRDAGFVRGQMRGRYRATAHWAEIHAMIVDRNPSVERALRPYGPERVA